MIQDIKWTMPRQSVGCVRAISDEKLRQRRGVAAVISALL